MKTLSFLLLSFMLLTACGRTDEGKDNNALLDSLTQPADPAAVEEAMQMDEVVTDYGYSPTESPLIPEDSPVDTKAE